jgi:uncharacterized Zn ribbon protein
MEDEIIYCDECTKEAIYKAEGLFLCEVCLNKSKKSEVKIWT